MSLENKIEEKIQAEPKFLDILKNIVDSYLEIKRIQYIDISDTNNNIKLVNSDKAIFGSLESAKKIMIDVEKKQRAWDIKKSIFIKYNANDGINILYSRWDPVNYEWNLYDIPEDILNYDNKPKDGILILKK